jgi:hypothetical protein
LDDISSKGLSYISLIDEKMMDLKDVVEPVKVQKFDAESSEVEPIKITPVSVSRKVNKKNKKTKSN